MADRLREEGREEARGEGELSGQAKLLLRQLALKFGTVPAQEHAQEHAGAAR